MKSHRISMPGRIGAFFCFLLLAACAAHGALRAADAVAKPNASVAVAADADATQAEEIQDLGGDLFYFRVTNLSVQMDVVRAALARHNALVLDLRGAAANVADARALRSALAPGDSKSRVARFVLIGRETGPSVPFTLDAGLPQSAVPGVVIIALDAAGVPADVKVPGSLDDDQRAREAIAKGVPIVSLINQQPEKKRYDEAVLMREHQGLPEPEEGADAGNPAESKKEDEQAKPVADAVLQAAVQTHGALVALKRL